MEPADPFTEAVRTGLEIGAEIVFADRMPAAPAPEDAYPDTYAIRYIGVEKYIEAYRVYPQSRSERSGCTPMGSPGSCRAPIRKRSVMVVVSLNLLDPVLDAMEEPQAQPRPVRGRGWSCSIRIPTRWAKSPSNIRRCNGATSSPANCPRIQADRPPARATGGVSGSRKRVRGEYRRAHHSLAAASAGALHAQPGARRHELAAGIFDLTVAARGVGGRQFRLGRVGDGR